MHLHRVGRRLPDAEGGDAGAGEAVSERSGRDDATNGSADSMGEGFQIAWQVEGRL